MKNVNLPQFNGLHVFEDSCRAPRGSFVRRNAVSLRAAERSAEPGVCTRAFRGEAWGGCIPVTSSRGHFDGVSWALPNTYLRLESELGDVRVWAAGGEDRVALWVPPRCNAKAARMSRTRSSHGNAPALADAGKAATTAGAAREGRRGASLTHGAAEPEMLPPTSARPRGDRHVLLFPQAEPGTLAEQTGEQHALSSPQTAPFFSSSISHPLSPKVGGSAVSGTSLPGSRGPLASPRAAGDRGRS